MKHQPAWGQHSYASSSSILICSKSPSLYPLRKFLFPLITSLHPPIPTGTTAGTSLLIAELTYNPFWFQENALFTSLLLAVGEGKGCNSIIVTIFFNVAENITFPCLPAQTWKRQSRAPWTSKENFMGGGGRVLQGALFSAVLN